VGEAETGEDAIEVVKEMEPDLVLMDLNLPGIDGLEATKRIVAERSKHVVVLMVSTYEAEEFAPRAAEAGAAAYISKSDFGPDQLEEAWAAATGS
jgi:DNA-binding NarL/FixJ family response regulator